MGRKSSAEIGPVHSPIGRHDAKWNGKPDQTKNTKRTKQNKNQKQTKQQPKNQTPLQSDIGPHSTVAKDNDFAL